MKRRSPTCQWDCISRSRKKVEKTIKVATDLAESTKGHEYKIHLYLPFPGMLLYGHAGENGLITLKILQDGQILIIIILKRLGQM